MKRRKPIKRRSSKTAMMRKCDALWSKAVHKKWGERCAVEVLGATHTRCSGPLQAHHIITRSVRHLRHDMRNGLLLCVWHHKFSPYFSAHGGPASFFGWLERAYPAVGDLKREQWEMVKPDYDALLERLNEKVEVPK